MHPQVGWLIEYRINDGLTTLSHGYLLSITLHPVQVLLTATLLAALMVKTHPFLGMDVVLVHEIDLKRDGDEKSFSSDGEVALQFIAELDY